MQHLSEVAHILGYALDGNTAKVRDYGEFLASKLTDDGETRQAHILRSILHGIPQPTVTAQTNQWACRDECPTLPVTCNDFLSHAGLHSYKAVWWGDEQQTGD